MNSAPDGPTEETTGQWKRKLVRLLPYDECSPLAYWLSVEKTGECLGGNFRPDSVVFNNRGNPVPPIGSRFAPRFLHNGTENNSPELR